MYEKQKDGWIKKLEDMDRKLKNGENEKACV